MTIDPEIVAYISIIVQSLKRFIPKKHMEWAVPLITLLAGAVIGYEKGGQMGVKIGLIAAVASIGVYEGPKQVGKKVVG